MAINILDSLELDASKENWHVTGLPESLCVFSSNWIYAVFAAIR
jgi:hypothetical protein